MSFTKYKNKIVYEKVLLVKNIHNSKDSLKKLWKLQIQFSEFDCLTGYSVLFLLFETNFNFMIFETNVVFVICSYVIWYVVPTNYCRLLNNFQLK